MPAGGSDERLINLDVELWVHPQRLGLSQPSVCLYHEDRAKGSQLLDSLRQLTNAARLAERTFTFRSHERPFALRKLKLKFDSIREDLKVMNIAHDREAATITMTANGIAILQDALANWLKGGEDFGVSPRHGAIPPKAFGRLDSESGELWFWGPGYKGP